MKTCNQYKHQHEFTYKQALGTGLMSSILVIGILHNIFPTHIEAQEIHLISPVVSEKSLRVVGDELITNPTPAKTEFSQEDIEKYIKTIFGKDAKVAIAVSHHECGPTNARYPKCNLHTKVENSVGLFQINIQSETTKVHWSRIPGNTLEEKKEWLENPYNNTLLAFWIFQTSGWNPWSAYTSKRYLADM